MSTSTGMGHTIRAFSSLVQLVLHQENRLDWVPIHQKFQWLVPGHESMVFKLLESWWTCLTRHWAVGSFKLDSPPFKSALATDTWTHHILFIYINHLGIHVMASVENCHMPSESFKLMCPEATHGYRPIWRVGRVVASSCHHTLRKYLRKEEKVPPREKLEHLSCGYSGWGAAILEAAWSATHLNNLLIENWES